MEMMHYLAKYVLIRIHFQKNIVKSQVQNSSFNLLTYCIRVKGFYRGDFGYLLLSLHKLELKKIHIRL